MHVDLKSFAIGAILTPAFILLLAPLGGFNLPALLAIVAIFIFLRRRGLHVKSFWLAEFIINAAVYVIGYTYLLVADPLFINLAVSSLPNTILPILMSGLCAWYFAFRKPPERFGYP